MRKRNRKFNFLESRKEINNKMGRPKKDQSRTEKIMFYVTPEKLSDFKTVAFINNKTMVGRLMELMDEEIEKNNAKLQDFRKLQNTSIH